MTVTRTRLLVKHCTYIPLALKSVNTDLTDYLSRRILSTTAMSLKICDGQDRNQVAGVVEALLENGWSLNKDQAQLEKTYFLKTYPKVRV